MKQLLFSCLLLCSTFLAQSQTEAYRRALYIEGKDTLRYRILYPLDYKPGKKYPVVVFLHGSGERGTDNEKQLVHGSKLFADSANRKKFPAFVIFPQCPPDEGWSRMRAERKTEKGPALRLYPTDQPMGTPLLLVTHLLDSLVESRTADSRRIYVGGLSMGGMGTFEILWRRPGLFAAAFPICGGGAESQAAVYGKKFPVWVFHGADDAVVDVNESRRMVAALKAAGARVRYSEYPGVNHNSWDNAFAEKDLLPWLFRKKKR
ncbi:MAG TPA: dienelactone hydrolase family protein [Flavisolibacter sp.]|jgi:predicted peptidase